LVHRPSIASPERLLARRFHMASLQMRAAAARFAEAKFNPNQPRVPAGNSDGGQWTGTGGGRSSGSRRSGNRTHREPQTPDIGVGVGWRLVRREALVDGSGERTQHRASDGRTIVSVRRTGLITGRQSSRHIVKMSDGSSLRVDNGRDGVQRIYDSDGALISASRWGRNGPEQVAVRQGSHHMTLRPAPALGGAAARALQQYLGGIALFNQMIAAHVGGQPVISFRAGEYRPARDGSYSLEFVGEITTEQADAACKKYPEVRSELTRIAREVRVGFRGSPQQFGTAMHKRTEAYVNGRGESGYYAEASFDEFGKPTRYGRKGSSRLDIYEEVSEDTVCVYDHKTGKRGLEDAQVQKIGNVVTQKFLRASRFIIIEVRPDL